MPVRDQQKSAREPEQSVSDWQIVPAISEGKDQRSLSRRRVWRRMPFGRYRGLTLPQVLFVDPDYTFWVRGVLKGSLATEAEELVQKA
jgi:hypothetical protein